MAVPPPAVGQSVRWQTKLASRKVCSGLRNASLKRQISTPCWLRKCSNSSFLPRTPSAFQQARHRDLCRSVLLGRAAIFGHGKDDGLEDSSRASCPCGEGGDGGEEPTSQLDTCLEGKVIEEIRDFLEWGCGIFGGDHQVLRCGYGGRGFGTRCSLLLRLPSSPFSDCCGFALRIPRPGRLSGGSHYRLLRNLRDRLRRGNRMLVGWLVESWWP
jgi:hypothetical protein